MRPDKFEQANKGLTAPEGMTKDECGDLPVYNDGLMSISCWKMTWRERLSALFFGRVWLWVHAGKTQPPVALAVAKTIFKKETDHAL
jgi:hypothetical protein